MLKYIKKYWYIFIAATFCTVILPFTYSYVPLFTTWVLKYLEIAVKGSLGSNILVQIDSTLPIWLQNFFLNGNTVISVLLFVVLALMIFQILRYLTIFLEGYTRSLLKENISKDLRKGLYSHIQDLSYKYHNNVDTGDLIQRVTSDIDSSTEFLAEGLGSLIYVVASIISGAVQLYKIDSTMMYIALGALPVIAIVSLVYFKRIDKIYKNIEDEESKMTVTIQENFQGMKVVKAFGNEKYEVDKLEKTSSKYTAMSIKAIYVDSFFWAMMDIFSMGEYLAITIVGIFAVKNGNMAWNNAISALGVVGLLIWPVRGLGRLINSFTKANVASGRLYEILDVPSEYLVNGKLTPDIMGNIEFRNVSFKFDDTSDYILHNVSFKAESGKTIAIVGKTGSGKSTIINLLLRMYEVTEGTILLDGVDIRDIEKHYLRSMIGTVLQDPFLYSKTVYENIAITNKNHSKESVINASNIASIAKDINTFKDGYDTLVGEKGTTLSGGQKQRVAIARVLVDKKPLLIFDDALSAVDNKTDVQIRDALNNKNYSSTNIIITHRITTAKQADIIIVLNNGSVENIGNHETLKNVDGLYKNLWDIQGKLELEFFDMLNEVTKEGGKL
jgi:ATP-binding cassette subfamily B protein